MSTATPKRQRANQDAAPPVPSETAEADAPKPSRGILREYFESGIVVAIMALFCMTFVGQAAAVPSASMQNTILVGDHFLINKFIFAPGAHLPFLPQRDIRRGDIVVFKYPSEMDNSEQVVRYQTLFIKRIIGLPGDTVEVRGASVYINGQPLPEHRVTKQETKGEERGALKIQDDPPRRPDEPYTVYYKPETLRQPLDTPAPYYFTYAVNGHPLTIPENQYFVIGDNRDNSFDSRRWGLVPRELVVGRALFVIWSYDESRPSEGFFLWNFFKNTRWSRTGTFIK